MSTPPANDGKIVEMRAKPAERPDDTETPPTAPDGVPEKPAGGRRRSRRIVLMVSLPLLLAAGGSYVWLTGGRYVATDNAYVQQDKVVINPEISGRIAEVAVRRNDRVEAGAALFVIDPGPYRIALQQSEAAVAAARLQVAQMRSAYQQAESALALARDTLDFRQATFDRQQKLVAKGIASRADFEEVQNDLQAARQGVVQAGQQVDAAKAALGGDPAIATDRHPMVLQALAAQSKAALDLDHTTVSAPAAGIVSQTDRLQVGQFVTSATPVMSLVETGRSWVEANFKESDLTWMRVGQAATITVDAYPDRTITATVDSIGAGTGSQFSLLPAENATGNWVKVVQRVPVELTLKDPADAERMRAGLSASVEIDTGHKRALPDIFGNAAAEESR